MNPNLIAPQPNYSIYYILVYLIVILSLMSSYSFINYQPTCNHYVMNVYLYIALSFGIILFISTLLETYALPFVQSLLSNMSRFTFITYFIITFGLTIYLAMKPLYYTDKTATIYYHLAWLLLIIVHSVILSTIIYISKVENIHLIVFFQLMAIFITMSILSYYFSSFFQNTASVVMPILMMSILLSIILNLLFYAMGLTNSKYAFLLNTIGICIFTVLIGYHTVELFEHAEQCKDYPNYPKDSLDLIYNLMNLFLKLVRYNRG
jgi:MFS family permease